MYVWVQVGGGGGGGGGGERKHGYIGTLLTVKIVCYTVCLQALLPYLYMHNTLEVGVSSTKYIITIITLS